MLNCRFWLLLGRNRFWRSYHIDQIQMQTAVMALTPVLCPEGTAWTRYLRLQSMGRHIRHDWLNFIPSHFSIFMPLEKESATHSSVLASGESQWKWVNLVGHLWGLQSLRRLKQISEATAAAGQLKLRTDWRGQKK